MGRKKAGKHRRKSGRREAGKSETESGTKAESSGAVNQKLWIIDRAESATEETMVGTCDMSDQPEFIPDANAAPADVSLLAEADAAIATAEPEALTETGLPPPDPIDAAKEFREVLHLPVLFVSTAVLPQWNITEEFRKEWTEASAECLAQLFPDGFGGKYACWFRLITCTGIIVGHGIAHNGGKLPGIGPKREKPTVLEHGTASPA
jgi:hypothetical protein